MENVFTAALRFAFLPVRTLTRGFPEIDLILYAARTADEIRISTEGSRNRDILLRGAPFPPAINHRSCVREIHYKFSPCAFISSNRVADNEVCKRMPNHECPTCGRDDFGREVDMKAHHTLAHGESLVDRDDPRTCPICGEGFASEGGMKVHHAKTHAESIAKSRTITESTRRTVLERDEYRCQRCNSDVTPRDEAGPDYELHHVIPFSAGGPNHPANLITLCHECHTEVHQQMKSIAEERPEVLEELRAIVRD